MNNEPQNISIENPVTMREVGIHLNNLSEALKKNSETERTHHNENIESNRQIIKKLEDMQSAFPSRAEFENLKKDTKDNLDLKAGKWTEKVLVAIGSLVGIAIVGAILSLILNKPN